jgi:hypothetical protein
MSMLTAQTAQYFDFLLSAKKITVQEINKTQRLESLKEKKEKKYNSNKEKSTANSFIIDNREVLLNTVESLYKKTFQEENEGRRAKYVSLARMLLSAIQKNKTAKEFCFILETTSALQDMKVQFNISGWDAINLLVSGYQLETSLSSLKLSGDRVVEIFSGLGEGNKKVKRIEFKETFNGLLKTSLLYKGSKRDDDVEFNSLKDFMTSLKDGNIIRFDGKAKTLLLSNKDNTLYKKEFKLDDNEEIECFLSKENDNNPWELYDISFSDLNKIVENIQFSVL